MNIEREKTGTRAGETFKTACVIIPVLFVIGLFLGFLAHHIFPWMIGNMQHAIQTRSFVWNADQAASDTSFVMNLMISVVRRSNFEIGVWIALLLGLPLSWLASGAAVGKK